MQEVRFWTENRTDVEIETWRHQPLQPTYDVNLALYFKMLEGTGTTTTDEIAAVVWNFGSDPTKYWGYAQTLHSRPGLVGWENFSWSYYIPGGQTADVMRLTILAKDNPDGVFRAGRLYGSDAWRVASGGKQYGSSYGVIDVSNRTTLAGGQLTTQRRASSPRRTSNFTLVGTDEEELAGRSFSVLMSRSGLDVVTVFDLLETPRLAQEKTVYGLLQQRTSLSTTKLGVYNQDFSVEGLT